MAIKSKGFNRGGNTEAAKPRPAAVEFPEAVAQLITTDDAEICDFGTAGAHLTINHGKLMGVPFAGDVGRNGPDTPRFTFDSLDNFLRKQGMLAVERNNRSGVTKNGEAYTVRAYVFAK